MEHRLTHTPQVELRQQAEIPSMRSVLEAGSESDTMEPKPTFRNESNAAETKTQPSATEPHYKQEFNSTSDHSDKPVRD